MNEIWKDVFGLEEYAMVSNLGRVKTKDRYVNSNGGMYLLKGKERKATDNGLGYKQITFTINGTAVNKYIHVMVLESFSDKPSDLHEVNHIDHDKSNNNLENLEWVTKSDNIKKMIDFHGIRKDKKYYCEDCREERDKTSKNKCWDCYIKSKRIGKEVPDKNTLLESIIRNKGSFVAIGREYGFNENSVRRWCDKYGIPRKTRYYKNLLKYLEK